MLAEQNHILEQNNKHLNVSYYIKSLLLSHCLHQASAKSRYCLFSISANWVVEWLHSDHRSSQALFADPHGLSVAHLLNVVFA